jgi:8-oxo-dGTP diphosphatase
VIEAAGGVVWRRTKKHGLRVLLVHRPRYDDWSLPKGKLDAGEQALDAALREVHEETGLTCDAGAELASTTYRDRKGRRKRARYWAMTVRSGEFVPNSEVDEIRWLRPDDAAALLTYQRDVAVVDSLIDAAGGA